MQKSRFTREELDYIKRTMSPEQKVQLARLKARIDSHGE